MTQLVAVAARLAPERRDDNEFRPVRRHGIAGVGRPRRDLSSDAVLPKQAEGERNSEQPKRGTRIKRVD